MLHKLSAKRRITDTQYTFTGLPLGASKVSLLACNAKDQCGASVNVGSYTTRERITYVHTDILGSPIVKTDQAGNVVKEYHYKPFGETEEEKQEELGYTGHLEDKDLELTYMQARYFDAHVGRFYSNDPVSFTGEVDTFNRYSYVANNPYKYVDPNGEVKVKIGAEATVVVVAGVRIGFSISLDTQTLDVTGTIYGGPRMGLEVGVAVPLEVESSSDPIEGLVDTDSTATVDVSAGLGAVGVEKELISENGTINGVADGNEGGADTSGGEYEPKIGIQMKGGASVGLNFKGSSTYSVENGSQKITDHILGR